MLARTDTLDDFDTELATIRVTLGISLAALDRAFQSMERGDYST